MFAASQLQAASKCEQRISHLWLVGHNNVLRAAGPLRCNVLCHPPGIHGVQAACEAAGMLIIGRKNTKAKHEGKGAGHCTLEGAPVNIPTEQERLTQKRRKVHQRCMPTWHQSRQRSKKGRGRRPAHVYSGQRLYSGARPRQAHGLTECDTSSAAAHAVMPAANWGKPKPRGCEAWIASPSAHQGTPNQTRKIVTPPAAQSRAPGWPAPAARLRARGRAASAGGQACSASKAGGLQHSLCGTACCAAAAHCFGKHMCETCRRGSLQLQWIG